MSSVIGHLGMTPFRTNIKICLKSEGISNQATWNPNPVKRVGADWSKQVANQLDY